MRFKLSDHIRHEAWHLTAITAIIGVSLCFQYFSSSMMELREAGHREYEEVESAQLICGQAALRRIASITQGGDLGFGAESGISSGLKSIGALEARVRQHKFSNQSRIAKSSSALHRFREILKHGNTEEIEAGYMRLGVETSGHLLELQDRYNSLDFQLKRTNWTYFLILAALLMLESIFIFHPLISRFRQGNQRLLEESLQRQAAASELEHAKSLLEERNEELVHKTESLEEMIENQKVGLDLLRVASNRFQELFHGIPFPCFSVDAESNVFEWNLECETVVGRPAFMVIGSSIFEFLISTEDAESFRSILDQVLTGETLRKQEMWFLDAAGAKRKMLVSLFPVRGANGLVTGVLVASVDITEENQLREQIEYQLTQIGEINIQLEFQALELEAANSRLEALATTDGLTGLKNHRAFREFLQTAIEEYQDSGAPVSLCLLDVDFFKKFNDSYGHQAGDEVLRGVSSCLRDGGGETGCVARYGGEEFVVVLPGHGAEQALNVAEFLRAIVEGQDWPHRQVTASFGVATLRVGTLSQNELIEMADQALYRSKERGRNCVTHYQDLGASTDGKAA